MTLHLSHWSEIRPSFESGHYGVHSTWGRNHRVPFTYVFLWEISSWVACGKLAYFLNIILGILSLLKMIWHPSSLLRVPVLKLVFLQIWDGWLRESLELLKVRQATFLLWWGMGDCSRSNKGELGIISNWFGIEQTVSHFFCDISVILDFWGYSWGLSVVPSSKSRHLTCLIGNMGLLCTPCRGIGPHLSPKGKSHVFIELQCDPGVYFRVTAGMATQTCVCSAKSGLLSSYDGYHWNLN